MLLQRQRVRPQEVLLKVTQPLSGGSSGWKNRGSVLTGQTSPSPGSRGGMLSDIKRYFAFNTWRAPSVFTPKCTQ